MVKIVKNVQVAVLLALVFFTVSVVGLACSGDDATSPSPEVMDNVPEQMENNDNNSDNDSGAGEDNDDEGADNSGTGEDDNDNSGDDDTLNNNEDDEGADNSGTGEDDNDNSGDDDTLNNNEDVADDNDSGDPSDESEEQPEISREIGHEIGNIAPDFTLPYIGEDSNGDKMLNLTEYRGDSPALVVFYRSYFCFFCVKQIKALDGMYDELEQRGVRVVGVSSDRFNDLQGQLIRKNDNIAFPLAYTSLDSTVPEAYDRFGYVRDGSYLGGGELTDPGIFLIDTDGVIVWTDLGTNIGHFVDPDTILEQIDTLTSTA